MDAECNLIFGAVVDPNMQQEVRSPLSVVRRFAVAVSPARWLVQVSITLIATGFGSGGLSDSSVGKYLGEAAPALPVAAAAGADRPARQLRQPAQGAIEVPEFLKNRRAKGR